MSDLYLAHHGVKGQKHGVRQWQNPDGSLTPAGRIHYGVGEARKAAGSAAKTVGKAARSVGKAIRKKVKPTNAELNAQIRKEKSKILNKQKKEELKRLKKTGQIEDPKEKRIGHKKYADMTDQEVTDRIKRLKNEAELATLEMSRNMGPGKRMVAEALSKGITVGIQTAVQSGLKKSGETFINRTLGFDEEFNKKQEKVRKSKELEKRADELIRKNKAERAIDKAKRKRLLKQVSRDSERLSRSAELHSLDNLTRTDRQIRDNGPYIPFQNPNQRRNKK